MTGPRTFSSGRATGWVSIAFLLVLLGSIWLGVRIVEAAPGTEVTYPIAHSTTSAASPASTHPAITTTPTAPARSVFVPDLTGYSVAGARAALQLLGLRAGPVSTREASAATGTVTATSPRAGVTVSVGTAVALSVSSGPTPSASVLVSVPDVGGMTQADATKTLADVGLKVAVVNGAGPAGQVTKQSPDPGTQLDPGATVTIVVGTG